MKQTLKQLIGLLPALCLLAACQDDIFPDGSLPGDGVLRLSGVNAQQVQVDTRADGVKGFFEENTHYRILMEGDADGNGDQYTPKLRFSDVGRDVVAGSQHFIQLLEKQGELIFKNEQDVVNFYGLTDPAIQMPEGNAGYQEFVDQYLPVEDFRYSLIASEEDGKYTLPDLRSAVSTGNSLEQLSYVISLQFKHILSKVNFEIVQQVSEETGEGLFGDLTLEALSVSGQPTAGTFCLKENRFSKLEGKKSYPVSLDLKEGDASIPITVAPKVVGNILLFPMTEETLNETNMLKVEVTLGGNVETLNKFGNNVVDKGNGKGSLTLTCPVYANNPAGGGNGTTPLRLLPNYEYDLQFVIMSNEVRIITIVPRVYEWLDGETDEYNDEEGYYEEQDLGQPITFNGVMWSDRNLGASSAHPLRSVEDWMKSVGYFYQYDRNIPYFPNSLENGKVDLNTPLVDALYERKEAQGENKQDFGGAKRKLYPVVNYLSWKGVTNYPTEEQFKPIYSGNGNHFYVNEIDKLSPDPAKINMWGFIVNQNNKGTPGLWKNRNTQPCPKGWRIPTQSDFMGALPGSVLAGNITFRAIKESNASGGWNMDPNSKAEVNIPDKFSGPGADGMQLPQKGNFTPSLPVPPPTLDKNGALVEKAAYLGKYPCIFRGEQNDPEEGAISHYVLSMKGDDWNCFIDKSNKYRDQGFVFNTGVVYGIKNVGTSKAYRMKWEVKLVSDTPVKEEDIQLTPPLSMYKGKKAKVYDGIYGVLVISRYRAKATDRLDPDENGSYEWVADAKEWWDNPVEVMYLPICGVAGRWNGGHLYNIGAESWYAMEEDAGNHKNIFWIKIAGGNYGNQALFFTNQSPKYDVVSIRPVRDN